MPKILREILALCLLALIPALASAFLHPQRPCWNPDASGTDEVLLSTILSWKEKVLWVDARSREEYEKDHIAGAKRVNEDEWNLLVPGLLEAWGTGQMVVVYCDSQRCDSSRSVARRLRELGVGPVYVLKGGWEELKKKMKDEGGRMK